MKLERWEEVNRDDSLLLSEKEIAAGWHFCLEFDGLLVGPGMTEVLFCDCARPNAARAFRLYKLQQFERAIIIKPQDIVF